MTSFLPMPARLPQSSVFRPDGLALCRPPRGGLPRRATVRHTRAWEGVKRGKGRGPKKLEPQWAAERGKKERENTPSHSWPT